MREKVLEFALMKQIRGYIKGSSCRRACAHRGGEVWPCGLRGRTGAPDGAREGQGGRRHMEHDVSMGGAGPGQVDSNLSQM